MKFNKEMFKRYYGKPYLDGIKIVVCADMSAVVLIIAMVLAGITVPVMAGMVLVGTVVLSIFPVLPLLICYYVKALDASKRQKQWFEGDKLHVLLIPEDGFVWGGFVKNTKEYIVHKVYDIHVSSRYIEISGEIALKEKYNDLQEENSCTLCRIPRNFSHEDELLKKLGMTDLAVQILSGR